MTKVKKFFKKIGAWFKKLPKLIKKNKIVSIICLAVIVVLIIILVLVLHPSKEDKLNSYLNTMGKDFYENFYYKQLSSNGNDASTFLSKYSSIGIKVDLDNLNRYTDKNKEMIDEFTGCDKNKTKVIFYPEDPYGKTDYKIETELSCGTKDTKKK